jgi:HlyD family secretion protein
MKKVLILLLALGLLTAAAACGAEAPAADPSTAAAAEQAQYVEAYGIVKSTDIRNVTLEFEAPVDKIHIKEGERVKPGQQLVTLDLSGELSRLENKELELQAAQNEIRSSLSASNPELKKLQNDLRNAQAVYDKDNAQLASKQALYDAGSISLSELDGAKRLVEADKKAVEDITYAIESTKNSKGTLKDQKSVQAAVLEADLKLLKSRLGKSYINGPDIVSDVNNGLVYEIGYTAGDITSPQKKLLSILNLDTLIVEANVPEEFIKDVKTGAEAIILPTADKSRQYKGKVTYISGRAFNNNGETLVQVNISIADRDDFLLPGYNVDVKISAG